MTADIIQPTFGKLTWVDGLSGWEAKVDLRPGCPIELLLSARIDLGPTHNIDELLQSGAVMLEWARRSESACREGIADKLLELYHDTWAPDDATTSMSRAEFVARTKPESLTRDIDGSGFFYWGDDKIFSGHWIEVRFHTDYTISSVSLAG
jgi:hypothetical protein